MDGSPEIAPLTSNNIFNKTGSTIVTGNPAPSPDLTFVPGSVIGKDGFATITLPLEFLHESRMAWDISLMKHFLGAVLTYKIVMDKYFIWVFRKFFITRRGFIRLNL